MSKKYRKTMLQKFEDSRFNKDLQAKGIFIDDAMRDKIDEFFSRYDDVDRNERWRKTIAGWIEYGVVDWHYNRERLENLPKFGEYRTRYELLYGTHGTDIYNDLRSRVERNLPNKIDYWLDRGYTKEDAVRQISKIQKSNSQCRTGEHYRVSSKRCVEYWEERGYTKEQAEIQVSRYQTRDLGYYIEKYGEEAEELVNALEAEME